jgi:anti-sigma-K factor RskA
VNVREYISSGIIESYVLGLANEAERQEFEAVCAQYPEIAEARLSFELALEERLARDAQQPPVFLKQQVEEKIAALSTEAQLIDQNEVQTPIRHINIWKWMAAASIVILAGALYWTMTLNSKYRQLQASNKQLEEQLQRSTARITELQKGAEMIQNPAIRMASLQSMPVAPGASGKVFWDTTSKDVYLLIHNLPQPASDKQYQLWALINQKPVDLGVFELKQQPLMVKMKGVQNAQAFAITLEPKGGSPTPTGEMYVMGKL